MENYNLLKNLVESISEDADKFYNKSNKSAGTRLRKSLQDVKKLAQEMRLEVSELKKS